MPDYNLLTYLRGGRKNGWLAGHGQAVSERWCCNMAVRLKRSGVRSPRDFYLLGTLMHYLADSFTYPHTVSFRETLQVHNAYERELKCVFEEHLRAAEKWRMPYPPSDPASFLKIARLRYEASERAPSTDAIYVIWVCGMTYVSIVK